MDRLERSREARTLSYQCRSCSSPRIRECVERIQSKVVQQTSPNPQPTRLSLVEEDRKPPEKRQKATWLQWLQYIQYIIRSTFPLEVHEACGGQVWQKKTYCPAAKQPLNGMDFCSFCICLFSTCWPSAPVNVCLLFWSTISRCTWMSSRFSSSTGTASTETLAGVCSSWRHRP